MTTIYLQLGEPFKTYGNVLSLDTAETPLLDLIILWFKTVSNQFPARTSVTKRPWKTKPVTHEDDRSFGGPPTFRSTGSDIIELLYTCPVPVTDCIRSMSPCRSHVDLTIWYHVVPFYLYVSEDLPLWRFSVTSSCGPSLLVRRSRHSQRTDGDLFPYVVGPSPSEDSRIIGI